MSGQNAEILQNMMLSSLNTKFRKEPPTEDEFMAEAKALRQGLAFLYPVSDQEFDQSLKNLKAKLLVTMDVGVAISDPNSTHQPWLSGRRADTKFFYWNRYKTYLEVIKGWNPRVTGNLDRVSDEILTLLGDPKSSGTWRRRGLAIGDVQSGKTASYTAVINKAADTGYKVIIVLAGLTDSLRFQTQQRLDEEFAGLESKHLLNRDIRSVFAGVGKIDPDRRIDAFTSVVTDFDSFILKNHGMYLKNSTEPALFVVKKNSRILQNLEKWLRVNNADPSTGKIDMPLLLIDDEADNASVNTKKPEQNPTAVNAAIRSILKDFTKATYLGITATPFANIFIDPDDENKMVGDDLFPKDFIYLLEPPSNYIGANAIFEEDAPYRNCLVGIKKDEMKSYLPFGHKIDHSVNALPPSLLEAMGYFVLANAIRDIRGQVTHHRSMLINVSRFAGIQNKVRDLVSVWLHKLRSDIGNYASLDQDRAIAVSPEMKALREVWSKYDLRAKAGVTWLELQQSYLHRAVGPIEVRAVNSRSMESLDYSAHKEGLRVIAVGGNSLSRGLTLEGLCVSYIYRNSKMYDTLLQMGRWFGYRPNYEDICKVWMAKEAIDWYGHITEATNELKAEIRKMNRLMLSPKDFGLKVRQHPGSLIATARNKMRTAQYVKRPISVQGRVLETPRLRSKPEVLNANRRIFELFVSDLDSIGSRVQSDQNNHLWKGVPKQSVVELLRDFDSHPWHFSFQGPALAEFIEESEGLDQWTVVIPNGSGDMYPLETGDRRIMVHQQRRYIEEADGMIKVSGTKVRVGAGGCTRAGLTEDEVKEARREFLDNPDNKGKTNVPDSAYLTKGRNPLLMLHVIQSDPDQDTPNAKIPKTLFAIGIGLPKTDQDEKTATYAINLIDARNWLDTDDDEDDDDGE